MPFEQIVSGAKTIELRLYDEKRQAVSEGDTIIFTNLADNHQVTVRVIKLHIFDTFIELYRSFDNSIGKLKVSLRTQSESLIGEFERFTELWMRLEQQYIIGHFPHGITYETGDGKFTRTFCLPPDKHKLTDDAIAAALSEYITMFDEMIKLYFANCADREKAAALVHKRYEEYYAGNMPII